ncbi:hypothetical protein KUTeg_024893 [Tegillarca granosa]|uniref:Uncharacterized protein n=1 Tax=Tegillarca granosa TaxID=220873 RepID=A0ABQ9E458_TEGGR|nr:hypothetical protein KUTeg_024893 [Tegillarca granosa]
MEWGKPKSEEWLCTFFLSFFESLCLVDPVKVVVMALLFALLFKKPTDVPNEKVNLERLKSAAMTYNAGMTRDSQEMSKLGKRKPPSSKKMQKMRQRRLRELQAYRLFFELLLYLLYAFFLYSITYIVRDDRTYTLKKHIESHLVDGTNTLFGFSNANIIT